MKKYLFQLIIPLAVCVLVTGWLVSGGRWQATQSRFKNFPLGKNLSISFDLADEAFGEMTDREVLDQARDWLLYTTLAGSDNSLEQINQSSYDLPAVRRGYLRPVANYEYGDTRSYLIGDGNVVVLIPADKADQRTAMLARAVDQHRKNTGEPPKAVVVFSYKLNWDRQARRLSAELARQATLDAAELFSKKYAYQESKISSLADLQRFMSQVKNISYAHLDGNSLIIGGRQTTDTGIGVEEVASLWQSEHEIQARLTQAGDSWEQQVKEFEARWSGRTYTTEDERTALLRQKAEDEQQLEAQRIEQLKKANLVPGSGFSLDPTYDFEGLKGYFDTTIVPRIRKNLVSPSAANSQLAQEIREASQQLAEHNADEFLDLMEKLSRSDGKGVASINADVNKQFGFQAARYDGQLRGTEVGMVLFYTDLMMKLWGWDYSGSAPRAINDFRIKTEMRLSPIYEQDLERSSQTRIWLGPQSKGFQKSDGNSSLAFAPIATRLFSKSSNPFKPGVEVETNAMNADYIGWWDDHYEEVARFEPQYQRLNQIMKWSLVISWLNEVGKGDQLGFLKDVPVNSSYWFPDWMKQHPELKFHLDDKLFQPKGYMGTKTEALPILVSKSFSLFGQDSLSVLSGGVSLGTKADLERSVLTSQTNIAKALRRSNLDYKTSSSADSALQTVEGTTYKLARLNDESMSARLSPKTAAKLRSNHSELNHADFDRVVSREGGKLNVSTRAAGVNIGDLDIASTKNGFKIAWSSYDIDAGQLFARRLSNSPDVAKVLSASQEVEMYIALPGESHYLVKLRDSSRWMDVSFAKGDPDIGWKVRVADVKNSVRRVSLNWLDPTEVAGKLQQQGEYLIVVSNREAGVASRLELSATGPVNGAETRTLRVGDLSIPGQADSITGATYFKLSELPNSVREEPLRLLFGWREDARIAIAKLENGGYQISRGRGTQAVNAESMPNLIDALVSHKTKESLQGEPLLFDLSGFTEDEAAGLLKNVDLRLSEFNERPSVISVFRNSQASEGGNLKSLLSEYDFARARISEPELAVIKNGVNAGSNELKMSAEIPAKTVGKASFFMRIRMIFKLILSNPKLSELRAAVREVFRRGVSDEANSQALVLSMTKALKKLHPEIRSVYAEYKKELLDLLIVKLERDGTYEWHYQQGRRAV